MATTVNLDGNIIDSETLFHTAFRDASGVEWYGGNLDALFDLMVGVVSGPINIVWTNAARSRSTIEAMKPATVWIRRIGLTLS